MKSVPLFLVILLVATLLVFMGTPRRAYACSCASISQEQAFQGANAVFDGTVTDIKPSSIKVFGASDSESVSFDVITSTKGSVGGEVDVLTPSNGGACGYTFQVGHQYTVYARLLNGQLETDLCDYTHSYSPPSSIQTPTQTSVLDGPLILVGATLAVVTVVSILVLLHSRGKTGNPE
ncbi:MAG: hypothetical protein HY296_05350 [Thaumarchaeota archaeon]|nr:hypothetical protein [Nitrososphaerota archaeon]